MAVIWGLDLREMQWGKFKSSYMWNNEYHMRRTKFILYQLAMILCVVSESLGTAALSDYVDQQDFVAKQNPNATVHNNNYVGIASYNIFVGVYVATIFGSAFFFDLFWPERRESSSVKLAWRICSILACLFTLSCALAYTDIVAKGSAYVTGVNAAETQKLLAAYGGSPLRYRDNGRAIASVVFLWPGMIFTFVSTYLLWHSLAHIDVHGPKSAHARTRDDVAKPVDEKPASLAESTDGATLTQPGQTHARPVGLHDRNEAANQQHSAV
ncbi:Nn.00g026870.m01.CDS01 [Neocucurbitaria sp. VM-36]